MEKILEKTKSSFLAKPSQKGLHNEATEWLSDLEFCKTELIFLSKLINKYFLRIKGAQKLSELLILEKKTKSFLRNTLKVIHDEIIIHEQRLGELDQNMFSQDEQTIRNEHKKISIGINAFMGSTRKMKKEIFDFVEMEMKSLKTG